MKAKKDFDAVEAMRNIRDTLHKEYSAHPELRKKRLAQIRKKIGAVSKRRMKVAH